MDEKATFKPDNPEDERREAPEPKADHESNGLAAPPSKSEAVRQALAAGFEGPQEGTEYILKEFGIDISTSQFLAVKATERKKGWAKSGKPGRKPKHSAESGHGTTPSE